MFQVTYIFMVEHLDNTVESEKFPALDVNHILVPYAQAVEMVVWCTHMILLGCAAVIVRTLIYIRQNKGSPIGMV